MCEQVGELLRTSIKIRHVHCNNGLTLQLQLLGLCQLIAFENCDQTHQHFVAAIEHRPPELVLT